MFYLNDEPYSLHLRDPNGVFIYHHLREYLPHLVLVLYRVRVLEYVWVNYNLRVWYSNLILQLIRDNLPLSECV